MDNKRLLIIVDSSIVLMAFLLSNLRALVFYSLFAGSAWVEIALWGIITLVAVFLMKRMNLIGEYFAIWSKNWLMGLFIFLALVSAFWFLDFFVTLFRALELLFATLVAAYIGMKLRPVQLSRSLFWFGAILIILSAGFVFVFPGAGRMFQSPYGGAWHLLAQKSFR